MISTSLEVYVTNEEEYTPYISPLNSNPLLETSKEDGFCLHQGETIETITYTNLFECSFDNDYEDITGSASVKLEYRNIDLRYFYKGVKCKLIIQIDEETKDYLGFITNVEYNQDHLALDIASYSKLLENKAQCTYTQQLRSKILEETIKEAGLIPRIDVTGLNDEVIDYTSQTQSNNETGETKTGDDCQQTYNLCVSKGRPHGKCGNGENWDSEASKGIAKTTANYYEWSKQFKTHKEMLLGLRELMTYSLYPDNRDNCASNTFNSNGFRANCGDSARLVKACCDSRGLPCVVIHGSPYGCGHYWNIIKINGSWETFDLCYPVKSRGDKGGTNTSNIFH